MTVTSSSSPLTDTDPSTPARDLFAAVADCPDEAERQRLLDEIVLGHLVIADRAAARYARRGIPVDDLQQVARLTLVRAVRDFDPTRGTDFLAYALPCIRGALKRYFRDSGWAVRPPRRVQEAQARLRAVRPDLIQRLHREPTVAEVARETGLDEETVIEALTADSCYSPDSLDGWWAPDSPQLGRAPELSLDDPGFELFETTSTVAGVLRSLSERDRRVLALRFAHGLTQREVGAAVGVSQMQVSRILTRVLHQLRAVLHDQTGR